MPTHIYDSDNDNDNDRQFIFRHCSLNNIKDIHIMYNVKRSHGASQTIQYM